MYIVVWSQNTFNDAQQQVSKHFFPLILYIVQKYILDIS